MPRTLPVSLDATGVAVPESTKTDRTNQARRNGEGRPDTGAIDLILAIADSATAATDPSLATADIAMAAIGPSLATVDSATDAVVLPGASPTSIRLPGGRGVMGPGRRSRQGRAIEGLLKEELT